MDATTVFQVAKVLQKEELLLLYEMLHKEININTSFKIKKKFKPPMSKNQAIEYLLENCFSNFKSKVNDQNYYK